MKVWTYKEMSTKVLRDCDLSDETFISAPELAGYFNEAIDDAEAEINTLTLSPDYFLSSKPIPVVTGQDAFPLPSNIYANKVRGLMYQNGSIIYPISRFKPRFEFEDIAFTKFYGRPDDYRYILPNDEPGQIRMQLHPPSRETAILAPPLAYPEAANPIPNYFAPVLCWYTRTAQRMPMPTYKGIQGELLPRESLVPALSIDTTANTFTSVCGSLRPSDGVTPYVPGGIPYVLGDIIYLTSTGTLPAPLAVNTPYYIIPTGTALVYKLATSLLNAQAGTAIDLTTIGTGYHQLSVVTTQNILDSLLVDIPQFATFVMQYVKVLCLDKDKNPRLIKAQNTLDQQRAQMVATLAEMVPDLDNEIEPDFSLYQEMS